jgi:hypothetical protein
VACTDSGVGIGLSDVLSLLCWPGDIVGWVHWSSVRRSINPVVVELACKMIPNS